jgi:hypothetical protein
MTRIEGQSGRLTLNDSYLEFGNWSIDANLPNKPGQNYWSGSFRIQESDHNKVFDLWKSDKQIRAEFREDNLKHSGEIMIIFPRDVKINSSPSNFVHFEGMGELK